MEGFEFYQEEGRPFRGRKLEKMKVFLARQGLDFDTKVQYSVVLRTREGEIAAPSLGFSTIILYEFINSYFLSSQHVCWLFLIFQKLDKNSFLLLLNWCYGVII